MKFKNVKTSPKLKEESVQFGPLECNPSTRLLTRYVTREIASGKIFSTRHTDYLIGQDEILDLSTTFRCANLTQVSFSKEMRKVVNSNYSHLKAHLRKCYPRTANDWIQNAKDGKVRFEEKFDIDDVFNCEIRSIETLSAYLYTRDEFYGPMNTFLRTYKFPEGMADSMKRVLIIAIIHLCSFCAKGSQIHHDKYKKAYRVEKALPDFVLEQRINQGITALEGFTSTSYSKNSDYFQGPYNAAIRFIAPAGVMFSALSEFQGEKEFLMMPINAGSGQKVYWNNKGTHYNATTSESPDHLDKSIQKLTEKQRLNLSYDKFYLEEFLNKEIKRMSKKTFGKSKDKLNKYKMLFDDMVKLPTSSNIINENMIMALIKITKENRLAVKKSNPTSYKNFVALVKKVQFRYLGDINDIVKKHLNKNKSHSN